MYDKKEGGIVSYCFCMRHKRRGLCDDGWFRAESTGLNLCTILNLLILLLEFITEVSCRDNPGSIS